MDRVIQLIVGATSTFALAASISAAIAAWRAGRPMLALAPVAAFGLLMAAAFVGSLVVIYLAVHGIVEPVEVRMFAMVALNCGLLLVGAAGLWVRSHARRR
jgi:hypothetical protein